MRRYILLLFFVLSFCLTSAAQARKLALLIGVDSYVSVSSLKCCVNDMNTLKEALMKVGFEEDDIQMLVTGAREFRDMPTKKNIERKISKILADARPTDIVFLAFSGHGAQEGQNVYFCPPDVELDDLPGSCVSINKVMDDLANNCKAKFKWMVVDACRNDPTQGPKGIGGKGLQVIPTPPAGIALFQSCAEGEESWEDQDSGNGFFTKNFAAALSGEADANHDGSLTLMEVCTWTTAHTKEQVKSSKNKPQRPYFSGSVSDFTLTKNLNVPKAKALAAEAQKAMDEENYALAIQKYDEAISLCPQFESWKRERNLAKRFLKRPNAAGENPAPQSPDSDTSPVQTTSNKTKLFGSVIRNAIAEDIGEDQTTSLGAELGRIGANAIAGAIGEDQTMSKEPKAGERKVETVNGVEFAFRWCPPGTFMMGSPESEEGRYDDEETQHEVTLTKGFWMMETEVTQKQWKAVMGNNPSHFQGDDLPVERVSWDDCQEFCKKCTQLGLPVQLPTEAQWEYACRAGTTGAYAGNLDEMAWYWDNSAHPVGTKKPNAWGLYDMHGNVWEWCQDWYAKDYPSGSVTDPTGPTDGSDRVDRGGSWCHSARICRSACRSYGGSGLRSDNLGFRVLRGQ